MDDPARYVTESLPQIIDVLHGTDVCELEIQEGELRVRLRRAASTAAGWPEPEPDEPLTAEPARPAIAHVVSPLVGTFYRAGTPGRPPLVEEGSIVEDETVVGIIEALNVLTEVEAGCNGVVTGVLATDGQPVEYGQVLFEVSTGD